MTESQSRVENMALKSTVDYSQPSLPFLLTTYGFEEKTDKQKIKDEQEKAKRKEAKKSKKKAKSFDDGEDEKALIRDKEKEEHYLKLVKDLYRLRDYYYSEYTGLLNDKVEKQRKEIRERDAKRRCQQEKEEEAMRKASHTVKKRLERHTLETTPATAHIPKSDIYHIVGLEEKLRREGKLKTQSDYNKFREEMEEPYIFYKTFRVKKASDLHSYPSSTMDHISVHSLGESQDKVLSMTAAPVMEDSAQRTLSRISESRESSKGGHHADHWAVTQQFSAVHKPHKRRSLAPGRKKSLVDAQNDLDRRFPKLEMPKLHCFTMNLAKKPPDPEEVRQQAELRAREKQRKHAVRTYTKMYQLAMSNAAVSNRILDQHEDMDMIINGPDLCDVIADHHWMTAYGLKEIQLPEDIETTPDLGEIPLHSMTLQESYTGEQGQEDNSDRQHSAGSSQRNHRFKTESWQPSAKSKAVLPDNETEMKAPPLLPLTMNEITDKCDTVEAKSLSTFWSNYLMAGK